MYVGYLKKQALECSPNKMKPDNSYYHSQNENVFFQKTKIEDYELVGKDNSSPKSSHLGKGAFGKVKRIIKKQTRELFALKIINKKLISKHLTRIFDKEIKIHRKIKHPHIIGFYDDFEDDKNIYIVMELAENGSLFNLMRKNKKFTENKAYTFFLQTALAIDYLHQNNIIHRDIKPENLLLDSQDNIKLCDFGWSTEIDEDEDEIKFYGGTVEYLAPEIIKDCPHDNRVDIWSLGILLYELLHGYEPFPGGTFEEKCKNIISNSKIKFDPLLSPTVCDLIKQLLKPIPSQRLTMQQIFQHPWMKQQEKITKIDDVSISNLPEKDLDSSLKGVKNSLNQLSIDKSVSTIATSFEDLCKYLKKSKKKEFKQNFYTFKAKPNLPGFYNELNNQSTQKRLSKETVSSEEILQSLSSNEEKKKFGFLNVIFENLCSIGRKMEDEEN